MDVLSDVIATMRTGVTRAARVSWYAPWGQRFASRHGGGFQVVLQGACWLIPAGGEPVELTAGDVVFFPHGGGHALADLPSTPIAPHRCEPHDGERSERRVAAAGAGDEAGGMPSAVTLCGAYALDPGRAHPLLEELPEIVRLPARDTGIRAAVDLLRAELDPVPGAAPPGADVLVPALLDTLLLYILRAWFARDGRSPSRWEAALGDPAIGAALNAVHGDSARPWTVAELGAVAGLSRAAFARRFAALTGRPPMAYLTWWRMTAAARLLRDTDTPLSAVAARVGYASESAFAHAFKRANGVAPGRYRRRSSTRYEGGG